MPIEYLRKSFIKIKIDDRELTYGQDYQISRNEVELAAVPVLGSVIFIYRETQNTRLVEWADASVLRSQDMTISQVQQLHILEEQQTWLETNSIAVDPTTGQWQGRHKRIININDPIDSQDVVTKGYIEKVKGGLITEIVTVKDESVKEIQDTSAALIDTMKAHEGNAKIAKEQAQEAAKIATDNKTQTGLDVTTTNIAKEEARKWAVGSITEQPSGSSKYWAEQAKAITNITDATETVKGLIRIATAVEAEQGESTNTVITPKHLKGKLANKILNDLGCVNDSPIHINASVADVTAIDTSGNITITIETAGATDDKKVIEHIILITNGDKSTIQWPPNVLWVNSHSPILTTHDIIKLISINKGELWYATHESDFADNTNEDWRYQIVDDKAVLGYIGFNNDIIVPGVINGYKTLITPYTFNGMFDYTLDVSTIDFGYITNGYGFASPQWSSIDTAIFIQAKEIIGLNLPNVTNLGRAFSDNKNLTRVNNITVGVGLTDTEGMFDGCSNLIEGVTMNTSNVTDFHQMYAGCHSLQTVPPLNTSKGYSLRNMFENCTNLPAIFPWTIDLASIPLTIAQLPNAVGNMFKNSSVTTVRFKNVPAAVKPNFTAATLGSQLTNIIIENTR